MSGRRLERGAALLTAMIIVTLISTLAAAMVWQQYRAVQVEGAERARTQAALILQGALDWARLILREDARANQNQPVDHLGEVWAVPLAEARLSTFLAADRSNNSSEDGPEAFLSGSIDDAQSRYNLRNLVGGPSVPPAELRALQRICDAVGVPVDVATKLADSLRQALAPPAAGPQAQSTPLAPPSLDQLGWLGLSAENLDRLRPRVILLPVATPLNLNTASRELLATVFDGMDLATAQRLVQARQSKPFQNVQEVLALVPASAQIDGTRASVSSNFFEIRGRLRLEDRLLEEHSVVQRRGLDMVAIYRQRQNLLAPTP
ncbi:MAG: type II secretion system minor pseudopilin GspK [Burkholderiaceae bacterium]|nr:type II secretion system minor pseudopilin GspK [Burkholderiaceae bacterium]